MGQMGLGCKTVGYGESDKSFLRGLFRGSFGVTAVISLALSPMLQICIPYRDKILSIE